MKYFLNIKKKKIILFIIIIILIELSGHGIFSSLIKFLGSVS